MPVINVADLDRDFQASARNEKLQEQEQTRRARMKFRVPKTLAASHYLPKVHHHPAPPPSPKPAPVELDPITKMNVLQSVCLTGLSQPIKQEKRMALRLNLEKNEVITSYIDDKVSSTILGVLGVASREVSFLLNYGTEYLRAFNGDQKRPDELANFTRQAPALVPMPEEAPPQDPQASPEDQMSAALLARS